MRAAWPWLTRAVWLLLNVGSAVVSGVSAWRLNQETERPKQANDLHLRVLVTEILSIVNVLALCLVVYRVRRFKCLLEERGQWGRPGAHPLRHTTQIRVAVRSARTVFEGYGASVNQVIIFTGGCGV